MAKTASRRLTTPSPGQKPLNRSLNAAKSSKQDEFYTQLSDIEKELRHYTRHFKNKTVLCNCDDPKVSKFFHYFAHNFERLRLKQLLTTCYKNQDADLFSKHTAERGLYLQYEGDKNDNRVPDPDEIGINHFNGDGDFRSDECVELLKQVDIVVTNPPFSLFREYVEQLMKHRKKFLIIGNHNAITYKEIYPYVLDGDERHLNIRAFSDNMKREAYEKQKGVCVKCKKKFPLEEMEADHITPWHKGGKTDAKNCQLLCVGDNRRKSDK